MAGGYFALPLAALGGRALPARFVLGPNYPDPFNPSTNIPYQLAASSQVRLEVFNLLGQRLATLVDEERPAGFHTATWHAVDGSGRAVAAGVYIYRMTVGEERQTGRMVLIDDPPQASGEDVSGVEVAAALSTPSIGADDVQSFLVSNVGAGYQPGDWLEPKDGGNQRMMVVGTGAGKPVASSDPASSRLHQRILKMQSAISPHSSPTFSSALVPRAKRVSQSAYWTSSSTFTQLSVVCMQGDRDIPTRGARYFSQPKTAQGAVQLCQQDCVLNETDNIQECVWDCEANAP